MLDEYLTSDQIRSVDEFVDASDFGPALEALADWLSERETPIPDEERQDFERLSTQIGNSERVMGALSRCPGGGVDDALGRCESRRGTHR